MRVVKDRKLLSLYLFYAVNFIATGMTTFSAKDLSATIFSAMASGWNEIFLAPIPLAILHAYFDLFSGFIQTFVFILLTTIFIGQEIPEEITLSTMERRNIKHE